MVRCVAVFRLAGGVDGASNGWPSTKIANTCLHTHGMSPMQMHEISPQTFSSPSDAAYIRYITIPSLIVSKVEARSSRCSYFDLGTRHAISDLGANQTSGLEFIPPNQ